MSQSLPTTTSEPETPIRDQSDQDVDSESHVDDDANAAMKSSFVFIPVDSQLSDGSSTNPLAHSNGRFTGQTVRVRLAEMQKADRGRKFATRDRRPLDPPPVVQIRFYRVTGLGSNQETEQEIPAKDVQLEGLLCGTSIREDRGLGPESAAQNTEDTTENDVLFGSSVVQCVRLSHQGQEILGFVFADLSVRREGTWRLHYQAFDVLQCSPGEDRRVLTHCVGESFRVYPNRQFPGLLPSTDLTKTIARAGIRTNHREDTRVRRKNSGSRDGASQPTQRAADNEEVEDGVEEEEEAGSGDTAPQ